MTQSSNLDELLRAYLERDAQARANGMTIAAVYGALQKLANRFATLEANLLALEARVVAGEERQDRHGRRLTRLERQAAVSSEWKPDATDSTGKHDLEAIKREVEEQRRRREDDTVWWQRQRWLWIGLVATGLIVLTIGACTAYVSTHLGK